MAIEKKLIHFNTKDIFDQNKDQIKDSSIVFVKDTNMIYTHGEEYQFIGWSYIELPKPSIEIPDGYDYVKPVGDDWWIDSEDKVILVME